MRVDKKAVAKTAMYMHKYMYRQKPTKTATVGKKKSERESE